MRGLSSRQCVSTLAIVFVLVVVGLNGASILNRGSAPGPRDSPLSVSHSTVRTAAQQLAWARASLSSGAGPTSVRSTNCLTAGCSTIRTALTPPTPVGQWTNLSPVVGAGPSGRWTQMTWDSGDGYVLLYGGLGCSGTCPFSDTWTFENGVWTNITATVSGAPPPLYYVGLASDPSSGRVILFGGELGTSSSAYTWAFHASVWTNLSATVGTTPPARVLAAMASDSTDGEIVMTAGSNSVGYLSDTWVFKSGTWTNDTSVAGLSGHLRLPTASDDPVVNGVLLVGVENGNATRSATLEYYAGIWHNVTSSLLGAGPSTIFGTAGYLSSQRAVVLWAGVLINRTGVGVLGFTTWSFAGGRWVNDTALSGAPPPGVIGLAVAVDPISQALIALGGQEVTGPVFSPYTYVLASPPTVSATVSKSVIDAGSPVTFSSGVVGGLTPNSVAWSFGDRSTNASGPSASHAYSTLGVFVATVTVTSLTGARSSASVSVVVNRDVTARVNASAAPTAGGPTSFSAEIIGGTGPFTYAWNFGDSSTTSTSAVADPRHTYTASGTYSVSFKVSDSAGSNDTETLSVVVAAAPSASTSLTSGTGLGLLLGIIILLAVVVALAIMLMRKPKPPVVMAPAAPAVAPYTPPPPPPS